MLQDDDGRIREAHSVDAGLDYPGRRAPARPAPHDLGRITVTSVTDGEALDAAVYLARTEGIIPALESAHTVSHARKLAGSLGADDVVVINVSGRGDKDLAELTRVGAAPAGGV